MAGTIVAYFIPIGLLLVAWGGLPPGRARIAASSGLMVAGLATMTYMICGFAFQFGGLGFATALPGYESLRGMYSPLDNMDPSWGVIGLRGFLLNGSTSTPEIVSLFLHHLPLVVTAVLIPSLALAGRVRNMVLAVITLLIAGLAYPLAGNWIAGGGWLANLGTHLQLGHGVVDFAGAGPVYLLGGLIAMVGLFLFDPQLTAHPNAAPLETAGELPPAHFPLLAVAGGTLFGLGWMAWVSSNPLYTADPALNLPLAMTNGLISAATAAVISQLYGWVASYRTDPIMAARGWLAGWIIVSAGAPFIPTWTTLVLGALAGIWLPLGLFTVERTLRRKDLTASVSVCGLMGLLGILVPGALADGNWGAGWNGVGLDEYLTVRGQGVTGALVPAGFISDPGQFTAQLVELGAIALLSIVVAGGVLGATRVLSGKRATILPESPPVREDA